MALETIDQDLCTGCGVCIDTCPMDVIRMDESLGKACVAYSKDCMTCLLCEQDCAEGAIEVGPERARHIPLPW